MVIAENFAPGTTAADIESAMAPIGGPMLSCNVTTSASTVFAELVFETRDGADKVIEHFHDQIVRY
jgi:RNA recognition motif. (a.k.a. RRM, RBD, or RNP domain)